MSNLSGTSQYFSEYVKYPTADFQREIFNITESEEVKMAVLIAFRGWAKSTIMTMSYPLWAIVGKQQKKCVVIISQTQQQVRTHFANLKREIEGNEILRKDLGSLEEESDEWGSYSLVLPKFNARIVAASSEQSIRGIRHGAYRPDLIICDDVEDLTSVKTKEGRDKTYSWLTGEVIPLGDKTTKIIMIGNLLHEDSLLMRLKHKITEESMDAIFREYPLVDSENRILWLSKFKDMAEIENFRKVIGDEKAWQREYMLKIVADEDQIVDPNWIQFYDELPEDTDKYQYTSTSIDLAISTSASADYTAMITAHIFGNIENLKIYILPNPINKRMDYPTTYTTIKQLDQVRYYNGRQSEIFIEEVGYQTAIIQQLQKESINAKGFQVHGQDKRARLSAVTEMIRSGKVLFPKEGSSELIHQLTYFGTEKHDDLVDAFSMLLLKVQEKDNPGVYVLNEEEAAALRGGGSTGGHYWNDSDSSFF